MIIATLDPTQTHELIFDLDISGTKDNPTDVRFIIEAMTDPSTGEEVMDAFSLICRAVRDRDKIKVYIPRLLNLLKSGSFKARLEVVLENRLFIPLNEEIVIEEPIAVNVPVKSTTVSESVNKIPEVTVSLTNVINRMLDEKKEEKKIEIQESESEIVHKEPIVIDKSWRTKGFTGIKNPFK